MPHQPRVLVVDDDENILSAFEGFLKKEHCAMVAASSAEEAFNIISHELVNLLITDVRMKWQSGATLLMKTKQLHPDLPVELIRVVVLRLQLGLVVGGVGPHRLVHRGVRAPGSVE